MIKNGDALKKKQSFKLKYNSIVHIQNPNFFKTSTLINNHCKNCETWEEKLSLHNWSYSQRKKMYYLLSGLLMVLCTQQMKKFIQISKIQ